MTWNPRYVLFARCNGRTPEQQDAHDAAQPARNLEFMSWVQARRQEYQRYSDKSRLFDNAGFGAWLERWVGERHPEQMPLLGAAHV